MGQVPDLPVEEPASRERKRAVTAFSRPGPPCNPTTSGALFGAAGRARRRAAATGGYWVPVPRSKQFASNSIHGLRL